MRTGAFEAAAHVAEEEVADLTRVAVAECSRPWWRACGAFRDRRRERGAGASEVIEDWGALPPGPQRDVLGAEI